jgi:PAS domain S-box-containing protein
MKDEHKTKAHLLSELIELRQRVAELEASQAKQVRSEEVLSKEDKFSELFRNLEEGVVINELILDEKGDVVDYIILEANSAFERQSPYKIEAVIGRRATDLYQMSPEYIRDWWRTHAELKEAAHTEMYHEPSDCWFHIVTTPLNERRFATIFTDISEPKRAQSALQESEEKFRSIMEQSVDGIVLADERGTIIEWNHGQEWLTGLKKQEALGRPVWDVLFQTIPEERKTPDVYELLKASTLNFLETGQSPWLGQLREADIQRPDGTRRSVQAVMFSIKTGKGFMSASISRDITEHKQTEYELRKLSLAVEQSNASIVITDITGAIEYVNPYFSELTGYTSEEALGKNPRILKSGYTSDHEYDDLWKVITKGQEWQGEFCNKKKNGELYWESASISPVMDSFGSITHFVAVKTDITERKQAELALQESEKKYRLLFEAANDSIFIMNADHILECNSKTLEMFGCQRKQIIGKRPSDFSPVTQLNGRSSRGEEFEKIEEVLKGKHQFFEWQHCRLDKTLFDVEVSLTPLELDDKVFIQAIVRDMTKHKQTEIELRRRADEFAALYETSRDLTAQYDLPTLLNTIVERARALLHAEGGGIYLYDPAHNDLEMALTVGTSVPTGARLKIGEGMVGRVAQTRQALIVDDYQTWEDRSLQYSTIPFRAVVQSPMLYAGELIGVLVAHEMGESERKFTEADSHLLSLFAEYAASAVHAARLLQETRRRAEETTALLEISLALTSLDLETTLESIGKQAKALFLADGCRIFLLEPGGETLRCVLALQESLVAFSDLRIKIGEGVTGRVAASGQAEIINEMQNDPRALQVPGTPDEEEAIMFAPLNERDQTIGVISIRRLGTGHPFLPSDLELLKAFASMAASAVSNARLFE